MREIYLFDDLTKEELFACTRARLETCFQHSSKSNVITVREKNTGRLVAFQATTIRERSEEKLLDPDDRSAGWLFRAIIAKLDEGLDLYDLYQTDRILHIWFTAVREDYRSQRLTGFANATCSALFANMAHDNNIGAIRAVAFSHFSSTEKCWKLIRTIDYDTFQLPDGTRPFAGVELGVHRTARLMACPPPPLINFQKNSDANMTTQRRSLTFFLLLHCDVLLLPKFPSLFFLALYFSKIIHYFLIQ